MRNVGRGMIATAKIDPGELIISERPLFIAYLRESRALWKNQADYLRGLVQALSKEDQKAYFGLRNNRPALGSIEGIMKTNCMPLGGTGDYNGLFVKCSRFNHSCRNNAEYSFSSKRGEEMTHAIRETREVEQICVNCFGNELWGSGTNDRKIQLVQVFAFDCAGQLCGASQTFQKKIDDRRSKIKEMMGIIPQSVHETPNSVSYLRSLSRSFRTYGSRGHEGGPHKARASSFASLSAKETALGEGEDRDDLERNRSRIENPGKGRDLDGIKKTWTAKVSDAREEGTPDFEEWLWANADCSEALM
ncbi:MAG: hypothetical protein M1814_004265 [Vezdaea aestivalis]|nr:MAG: hypothetical protein M1814_004265 [Vezdaea aestivalis]